MALHVRELRQHPGLALADRVLDLAHADPARSGDGETARGDREADGLAPRAPEGVVQYALAQLDASQLRIVEGRDRRRIGDRRAIADGGPARIGPAARPRRAGVEERYFELTEEPRQQPADAVRPHS